MQKQLFLLLTRFICLFIFFNSSQAQILKHIELGENSVGFKRIVVYDSSRTHILSKNQIRPVIINMWYPAKMNSSEKMNYERLIQFNQEYLGSILSEKLSTYNEEMIKTYAFDKKPKKLNSAQKEIYQKLLSSKTNSIENAEPIKANFPLIIYHQGAGAPISDNPVTAEYLASHGYVVCNAAYQYNTNEWIGVGWDFDVSISDIDIIIQEARKESFVDQEKLGLFGHSIGGDLSLAYIAKGKFKPKAIVTLDSHFGYCRDYKGTGNVPQLLDLFWNNIEKYDVPMMNFAAYAFFPVLDSLVNCKRTYVEISHLGHEEFTSNGFVATELGKSNVTNPQKNQNFQFLLKTLLSFFESEIQGSNDYQVRNYPKNQFHFSTKEKGTNETSPFRLPFEIDSAEFNLFEGVYKYEKGKKNYKCKVFIENGKLMRVGLSRNADYFWNTNKAFYTHPFRFYSKWNFHFHLYIWGRFVFDKNGQVDGFITKWFDKKGNVQEAFNTKIDP